MDKRKSNKIKLCRSDRILNLIITASIMVLMVVIIYPLIYVVSCSFSSGAAVSSGKVILFPVDLSLIGYKIVFSYNQVWVGYKNTIIYTTLGTVIGLIITVMAAYPLSRKDLEYKNFYTAFFMITMFFSGGIIPSYLVMTKLGLTNTRWSVILSGALNIYNMLIMKTFFQNNVPKELLEAARIDGVSDFGYLMEVVLPLSKSILAVIALYYAVGQWNSYFNAMLYVRDRELYPLQMVLRDILNVSHIDLSQIKDAKLLAQLRGASDVMKYSLIVVSSVPILAAYPFVQRFFEKGVMIGSVKE